MFAQTQATPLQKPPASVGQIGNMFSSNHQLYCRLDSCLCSVLHFPPNPSICTGPPSAISCARAIASCFESSTALARSPLGLLTAHLPLGRFSTYIVTLAMTNSPMDTNSSIYILATQCSKSNDMEEWNRLVNARFR